MTLKNKKKITFTVRVHKHWKKIEQRYFIAPIIRIVKNMIGHYPGQPALVDFALDKGNDT